MIETIINDIHYRLDEDNLTAEVIRRKGFEYEGNIIIPETTVFNDVTYRVTSIGEHAFDCCSSLTFIVLPDSVTSIEWWAFCGCKSLTDITFQGTIAQWNKIKLRDSWKHNIPATVVHCTDGDVEI